MSGWTVYAKPRVLPDGFVARRWEVRRGRREPVPTADVVTGATLEDVRAAIPPGLHRMPRRADDDPVIVEVWI